MRAALVPTSAQHAEALAAAMRAPVVAECAALGLSPAEAVRGSLAVSHLTTTMLLGQDVLAMAGLVLEAGSAMGPRVAQAWALTSVHVDRAPLAFYQASKAWVRAAHRHADVLWNWVDARFEANSSWLKALGFVLGQAVPHGPHGVLFRLAVKEA